MVDVAEQLTRLVRDPVLSVRRHMAIMNSYADAFAVKQSIWNVSSTLKVDAVFGLMVVAGNRRERRSWETCEGEPEHPQKSRPTG